MGWIKRTRARIALNHDVASEARNLGSLLEAVVGAGVVAEAERRSEAHSGGVNDLRDVDLLSLVLIVVGGGDHKHVANLPRNLREVRRH